MIRYRIIPDRSRVWIDARSNVHPIHTVASGLNGWVELLESNEESSDDHGNRGHLEFPVKNLTSANPFESRELHRRIDAHRFPVITGDLRQMTATGRDSQHVVQGDLTFLGVTRSYQEEMTVDGVGGDTLQLAGQSTFDIRDFGMEPPRMLMLKVHPDVTVRVELLAARVTDT